MARTRAAVLLAALVAMLTAAPAATAARKLAAAAPPGVEPEYFIGVDGGGFTNGCARFGVAGWNAWEMVEAAAGAPYLSGASLPENTTGPALVRAMLDQGVAAGLNVLRAFAFAVNPQYSVQPAPGRFSEAALRGLDYLLDEARKRGIRLILALASNWTPTGGVPEYLKWGGSTKQVDFFTDAKIQGMYKDWVKTITSRVNSINGRTYAEDPTIMAWDLLNEPRCNGCPKGTVAQWYDTMARHLKTVDPNHLVTTGEEGFYACCKNPANPGQPWSEWAADEGQDFIADHSSPAVDFATIHASWISAHAADSQKVLKKPLLLEEFGKWVTANATIGGKFVKATLEVRDRGALAWAPAPALPPPAHPRQHSSVLLPPLIPRCPTPPFTPPIWSAASRSATPS